MAKFYNNHVKTGKLAGSVFAIRNGETIERAYQPVVFNPSTAAQVAQRAKLKMLSQLSAVLASVIAIPREGAVSARNLFTKLNFPIVTYATNKASANLSALKLTKSDVFMFQPYATVGAGSTVVTIADGTSLDVDRVVYVVLIKSDDDKVRLLDSQVIEKTSSPTFEATFTGTPEGAAAATSLVILAYGIRANSNIARARYQNVNWASATAIAELVVNRTLLASDFTLTETRSAYLSIPDAKNKSDK